MRFPHSLAVMQVVAFTLLSVSAPSAHAQERTLSWPDFIVTARLDADGTLHVSERQRMRFSGEWNGGERRFNVGFAQRFDFGEIVRIDSATGRPHAMIAEQLDVIDGYGWADNRTLRWRSRKADDPPFDNTVLTYQIDYAYRDIVDPLPGGRYRLSHDFAFADREGAIDHFALTLTIDRAWGVPGDFTGEYETTDLERGRGFIIAVPLSRTSATPPANVRLGAPMAVRIALLGLLVAGLIVIVARLLTHDARRGRFARAPLPDSITDEWLETNVFAYLPEVVGATWDGRTSEPEVAATLARLVQEGKLRSRVETEKVLVFRTHVLHLELVTARANLQGHERLLIDSLFYPKDHTTDTDAVRKRYKKSGFNPASVIRAKIERLVEQASPSAKVEKQKVTRVPTLVLLGVAAALLLLGMTADLVDGLIAVATIAVTLPLYLVARGFAKVWQHRVDRVWPIGVVLLAFLALMTYAYARTFVFDDTKRVGWLILAGLAFWGLALANSVANGARLVESAERVALRKRFAAARAYFRTELAKREPRLKDSWYPYMLAFGLGKHVDRWFTA
ncbi:MAG: DUF2207 domain-containing protein, partial [Gemmatimonas sp.]